MNKRQALREELTQKLLVAGTQKIAELGLDGLRARDVTDAAGCGLGTLYKCYQDLDDLIIHINSTTLLKLAETLEDAGDSIKDPVQRLVSFAHAYSGFAAKHLELWSALFDHRMPEGRAVPDWHIKEHEGLFDFLRGPLKELHPNMTKDMQTTRARGLFAAVHGIVALSLQGRFIGVPRSDLRGELTAVTTNYALADVTERRQS